MCKYIRPNSSYLRNSQTFTATDLNSSQPNRGVIRGRGGNGCTISLAPNHYGAPCHCGGTEKSQHCYFTNTFFNTVHLLPKELRFEHGGFNLASWPGRHLTSLYPCSQILNNIFLPEKQQYGLTYFLIGWEGQGLVATASERSCSVTMSDRRFMSQHHSFVIIRATKFLTWKLKICVYNW